MWTLRGGGAAVMAYADRQGVRPGGDIDFKVSCVGAEAYRVDIVQLLAPAVGTGPHTPDFREVVLDTPVGGEHPARRQPIYPGSCVLAPGGGGQEAPDGLTICLNVFPTRLESGRQTIFSAFDDRTQTGIALFVEGDGRLGVILGAGTDGAGGEAEVLHSRTAAAENRWTSIAVSWGPDRAVRFYAAAIPSHLLESPVCERDEASAGRTPVLGPGPISIGARIVEGGPGRIRPVECFNGRIERPRLFDRALNKAEAAEEAARSPDAPAEGALADWDFSIGVDGEEVTDVSGGGRGARTVNLPTRGVAGSNWSGDTTDWRVRPGEYGAIHFHEDDLSDAGWETDFTLTVPDDWPSGCYAGRFRAGGAEFYAPFAVLPPAGGPTAEAVFVLPTATYCAYANMRIRVTGQWNELIHGRLTVLDDTDLLMIRFPELGLSTYDSHSDGSTVVYSSMHRPVTNFRPKGRIYKFCQDLLIVAWLEAEGVPFDVITDEDLDRQGAEAVAPYRTVITASHPEYVSTAMFDAVEEYLRGGGRLMYLGGNGFWHRFAYHPRRPGVGEVRRTDLPRLWASDVSQGNHSFTGEPGGTWVGLGRAPHLVIGGGFVTQGFDECSYYRRTEAADDPRARFIFEGIDNEIIGDFGLLQNGAAGYEIDRADAGLGTPAHALVVASSENHSNLYDLMVGALEDTLPVTDPDEPDRIRADMVFFETPGGGAVFSVGSIAWSGSLSYNGYDNNAAGVSRNVLRRFLDPAPFEMPGSGAPDAGS